jgi:hypothetical protein
MRLAVAALLSYCFAADCPDDKPMNWTKLVHYHQHKAAGITVRGILKHANAHEIHSNRPPLAEVLRSAAKHDKFVLTFVRAPVPRTLSRFWYWRADGHDTSEKRRKARCLTLAEYARAHARPNNQHEYMLGAAPLGACAAGGAAGKFAKHGGKNATGGAAGKFAKHGGKNKTEAPADVCPAGAGAYARRVDALLAHDGLLVGVVERFDLSLLLLARLVPGLDVRYCLKNAVAGAPKVLDDPAALDVLSSKNRLDAVIHARADEALVRRARCAFGDDAAVERRLADFAAQLRAYQASHCNVTQPHQLAPPLDDPSAFSQSRACLDYRAASEKKKAKKELKEESKSKDDDDDDDDSDDDGPARSPGTQSQASPRA